MSYCLNPDCQRPQNRNSAELCRYCAAKLLLKDRYRPLKPIGQGGFGRTFLAIDEDKPSRPRCVIKQFLPTNQDAQHLKKAAQLFEREAMRLEELGNHPQIPALLAYFRQEQQQYLVQEFVDGKNLAELLHEHGAFTENQVQALLRSLLPVLEFIHVHGVIHRDIKPSNIIRMMVPQVAEPAQQEWTALLHVLSLEAAQGYQNGMSDRRFSDRLSDRFAHPPRALSIAAYAQWQQLATRFATYADLSFTQRQSLVATASRLLHEQRQLLEPMAQQEHLALVDFGAAKAASGTTLLRTGTTIGSPEYLSPEQSRGKAVFASDLFSLGVTCIHLLTHRSPFDLFDSSDNTWIWRKYVATPVSDKLGQVLDRLLEPGVNRRYQAAADVLHDLNALSDHTDRSGTGELLEMLPSAQFPLPANLPPPTSTPLRSAASAAVQALAQAIAPPSVKQPSVPGKAKSPTPARRKAKRPSPSWLCAHQLQSAGKVYAICLAPGRNTLNTAETVLASSSGTTIKLWDVQTGQVIRTLTGHLDIVSCLVMSLDGQMLISGSADKSIRLWDVRTGQRIGAIALHTDTVLSLALSPDGRTLASGSLYDPVKLWDLDANRELTSLSGQAGRIEALAFSPDGLWLASGSSEATIALWDLKQNYSAAGRDIHLLKGHTQTVSALAFEPDGKTLSSGSWDGTVKLWSTRTQREKRALQPESGRVTALAVSADGKLLCTGSDTLKLWQPRTGKAIATLAGQTSMISAIALTPDSKTLVSSSWDGTIWIWKRESSSA
ncbi:MAG: protein kinase [Stenomitos rutilans HA7619-LM2]|jgi:serine/threonine protein kinase|nr:protein kinase [Stenomitos rutilans HA7619-LM2]